MSCKHTVQIYSGLDVINFDTTEANIKALYFLYYGWPIDAPHRKLTRDPLHITGSVVVNGLKRSYKELQTTLINERFWSAINGCKCLENFLFTTKKITL